MSSLHVALAGATGNLGPAILQELISASLRVTVLTRAGSTHKIPESVRSNKVEIREVDYNSHSSLVSALDSVDVLVSTLGFTNLFGLQKNLIDACVDANVSRFIPSEFGNDSANELVRKLPVFADKIKTQDYLEAKVAEDPTFSYTLSYNNSFLDWQLQVGFMVNLKEHTATLYDGGDIRFSATRLATIGKAVVGITQNLDATKNQHIYFHDAVVTQNQLIEIAKRIDGKEWVTNVVSTAEIEKNAYDLLSTGNSADIANASLGFIARACYGEGYGGDFSEKIHNELLGIPEMSEEDIQELVESIISATAD